MWVSLLCLLALGVQATYTYLGDGDDSAVIHVGQVIEDVGRQNVLLKRKHRTPNKNKNEKTKMKNKQGDIREKYSDTVIPEPQEYIPPRGKLQKASKSPMKNKRGKTKVNSEIKHDENRETLSDDVIPEPQQYIPPRGKQKPSKLSAFGTASVAQGVQFIADIVTIVSSDFWKWMDEIG